VILKSEICLQLASEDLQFDLGLTRDLTVWICKYAVVTLKYMLLASCMQFSIVIAQKVLDQAANTCHCFTYCNARGCI